MFDAIIVGAGFSGLYQLHLLRDRLGLNAVVLERAGGVGGTWWWNRYPGARCDSESHSYQFMFSRDLAESWEWSERYPAQPEVLRYLEHVADRLDLRRDIRLNTGVASAERDEAANLWRVRTEAGELLSARFLIAAVGCLSAANVPDIPSLGDFAGERHHTGEWPHGGVDFSGKRVGLIGTGSTGIQAAPVIAETAAHLTVFQRTPNYSVPARNAPLTHDFKAWAREAFEEIRATTRETTNGHPFRVTDRSVHDVSDEEREAILERQWEKGGLQFRAAFRDVLTDARANALVADFVKRKIRGIVKDPAKAELLAAMDHPYAAKRPPIDTDYFETFNRPNVALVDVARNPIERITPHGVLAGGVEHGPLDILVFATGFDAMTGPLLKMDIRGRGGVSLREAWAEGPRTLLGLMAPGFPNLFTVTGPGSPSVLTNMPVAIEQHCEWIADCVAHLRATGARAMEATEEGASDWAGRVREAAEATLFPQASSSWYLGANVPGKPRVFMPYAGGLARYRAICDDVAARGYPGFSIARPGVAAAAAAE